MKKIGIVVCNYNKEDYIAACINSLIMQSIDDFDIYVVDNASTDCSVKKIKEEFGSRVNLIVNEENLGGSGGFNTGLKAAMEKDYKYIMLMDNDIIADKHAVEELLDFMEKNADVGMAGSKVYYMDEPQKIWGYGGTIDFDKYVQRDKYKNMIDCDEIPDVSYCDYVAACSLMVRKEAVEKVGLMPEENFIYWDDMEWGYRFNLAGYRVATYGKSKIWHKGGGRNAVNTFSNYYMWRNRIKFFIKFLTKEEIEKFADVILNEMFRMIYGCHIKGEDNVIKSVMYAFDDAVHNVMGKADEYKILPRNRNVTRLEKALGSAEKVLIKFNGDFEGLGNIVRSIKKVNDNIRLSISVENADLDKVQKQYSDCEILDRYEPEKYDFHMIMCEHIFKLTDDMPKDVYIDTWCNIVYTQEDYMYAISFNVVKDLFVICKRDMLIIQKA